MNLRHLNHKLHEKLGHDLGWVVVHGHDSEMKFVSGEASGKDAGALHYELYESKHGMRDVEISFSGMALKGYNPEEYAKTDSFYITSVKPWLRGVRITTINTYEQARQQLSMEALQGDDSGPPV